MDVYVIYVGIFILQSGDEYAKYLELTEVWIFAKQDVGIKEYTAGL